jgi:hypothetical protein
MIIPLEKNIIVEYTPIRDKEEPKTVFSLGYLTSREKAALAIISKKIISENAESSSWWFPIIQYGVKGWKNIKTADGTDYAFKTEQKNIAGFSAFTIMSEECFEIMDLELVAELAAKLYEMNYSNPDEKKS